MQKKGIISLSLLALMLLGTACHNQAQTTSNTSTESSKVSHTKKKSHQNKQSNQQASSEKTSDSQSTATKDSTEESSQSSASTSKKSAKSSSQVAGDRLTLITDALKTSLPGEKFPQAGINTKQSALSSRYTGNTRNYTVFYYTTGNAVDFNDSSLANRQAAATLQKQTYASTAAAQSAINYHAPVTGLPTVDLGTGIYATKEGAAGSSYLNWTEGRWSLVVRSSNVNNEVGEPLAKQVVTILHTQMLPIPDLHGAINLYVSSAASSRMNTVTWSKGTAVYTISAADPIIVIQMATSLQ
ncbi:hypothetical protein [Lapidilactobacillus bayanensis]|uniref:hypothetical protein n=1 Tax=Lapidilactobacillus bayanensis TaxID=2485998 RepID=UPI000F794E0D|nr:hypothetical protein [Lapidilactobacillus bayanensis]